MEDTAYRRVLTKGDNYAYVLACVCMSKSEVIPQDDHPPCFWRQGLLPLAWACWSGQARGPVSPIRVCLSLPQQHWDYKPGPTCLASFCGCWGSHTGHYDCVVTYWISCLPMPCLIFSFFFFLNAYNNFVVFKKNLKARSSYYSYSTLE